MLDIESLSVDYGTVHAVRNVSMRLAEGEAVALLGPNAAGKTSTLRAISQLIAYKGTIKFDGQRASNFSPDALARLGVAHVPEGRHVIPSLTVHENLQIGLGTRNKRLPIFEIEDVYELFPRLKPIRNRLGWALSGGEQQMTVVGRALVGAPRLLMLDEPSLGLAPALVTAVFQALERVKTKVTILVVEQNTAVALSFCDRAYVLSGGGIQLAGSAREVGASEHLLASYLGRTGLASSEQTRNP